MGLIGSALGAAGSIFGGISATAGRHSQTLAGRTCQVPGLRSPTGSHRETDER